MPVFILVTGDMFPQLKRNSALITISHAEPILQNQAFIQSIRKGDQVAFQSLVREYQDRIFHVCLGFVPVQEDAEDLTQEVFVEVFRSISSFRGDSKLGTWIHRIAISKSLELQRYRKRQKRQAFFKSVVGLDEPAAVNVGTMLNHPGIMLEDQERATTLYEAIDKLPDNQKTVFSLRQIQGMSQKETAEMMNISEKAVESYQSRAKQNLKKHLGEWYRKEMKQ